MIGFDAIGFAPITGPASNSSSTPLTFQPVSRIVAGGWSNSRPAAVAVLGAELLWDNGDNIFWDNGDYIIWS